MLNEQMEESSAQTHAEFSQISERLKQLRHDSPGERR